MGSQTCGSPLPPLVHQVLIPISLYVSIEFVKLGQIYFIHNDLELYNEQLDSRIQCRAFNITEDLGQIRYLFSDKTGTLTENKMVFRRCSVFGVEYPHVDNGKARVLPGSWVWTKESLDSTIIRTRTSQSWTLVCLCVCSSPAAAGVRGRRQPGGAPLPHPEVRLQPQVPQLPLAQLQPKQLRLPAHADRRVRRRGAAVWTRPEPKPGPEPGPGPH